MQKLIRASNIIKWQHSTSGTIKSVFCYRANHKYDIAKNYQYIATFEKLNFGNFFPSKRKISKRHNKERI